VTAPLLSPREVVAAYGVPLHAVRQAMRTGALAHVRVSRSALRTSHDDVAAWLSARRVIGHARTPVAIVPAAVPAGAMRHRSIEHLLPPRGARMFS